MTAGRDEGGAGGGRPEAIKLLLADDEATLRSLLRVTFDAGRLEILEAADGQEALDIARREVPHLVFLDWNMPGASGMDVARILREDPLTRDIPIVMLTARAQEADRQAAAGLVDHYITKPFSPLALLTTVSEILGPDALT